MFQIPSFKSLKLFSTREKQPIDVRPVKAHDLENAQEKNARALKHLLKLNHANNAILWNNRKFHNHAPHVRFSISYLASLRWLITLTDSFFSFSVLRIYRVRTLMI